MKSPALATLVSLAGLLAGDYDVIESPAARDLNRIKGDKRFGHVVTPSTRIIYAPINTRETRADGSANPLSNVKLRQALNYATDKDALVEYLKTF